MQQKGFNHVSFDLTNYKSIEKLLATQYLDIFKKKQKNGYMRQNEYKSKTSI